MDGDWDAALALADLAPRLPRGDQGRGKYAPTTAEVLDRAYEAHGTELTSKEIWTFVKANGIPYSRERGRLWSECVSEWKQDRAVRGLDVPAGPPPLDQRPDYSRAVGAALPGESRRQNWRGSVTGSCMCSRTWRSYPLERVPRSAAIRSQRDGDRTRQHHPLLTPTEAGSAYAASPWIRSRTAGNPAMSSVVFARSAQSILKLPFLRPKNTPPKTGRNRDGDGAPTRAFRPVDHASHSRPEGSSWRLTSILLCLCC